MEVLDRPHWATLQIPTSLGPRVIALLTTLQQGKEQATDVDIKKITPLPTAASWGEQSQAPHGTVDGHGVGQDNHGADNTQPP